MKYTQKRDRYKLERMKLNEGNGISGTLGNRNFGGSITNSSRLATGGETGVKKTAGDKAMENLDGKKQLEPETLRKEQKEEAIKRAEKIKELKKKNPNLTPIQIAKILNDKKNVNESASVEFYQRDNKNLVLFNSKEMSYLDFIALSRKDKDAKRVLEGIKATMIKKSFKGTVGDYIRTNFMGNDRMTDVVNLSKIVKITND